MYVYHGQYMYYFNIVIRKKKLLGQLVSQSKSIFFHEKDSERERYLFSFFRYSFFF